MHHQLIICFNLDLINNDYLTKKRKISIKISFFITFLSNTESGRNAIRSGSIIGATAAAAIDKPETI